MPARNHARTITACAICLAALAGPGGAGAQEAHEFLSLRPDMPAPQQIGEAAQKISASAGPEIKRIDITPRLLNLRGPTVKLMRRDLENALSKKQGSAEEIWRNTEFDDRNKNDDAAKNNTKNETSDTGEFRLALDSRIGISGGNDNILRRTSVIAGYQTPGVFGLLHGFADLRLNLDDNLKNTAANTNAIRSDAGDFAQKRLTLDTAFAAFTRSVSPELHVALLGGYLEEMYGGAGGEILYRPFGSRFSFSAESWLAFKRDPNSAMAAQFTGQTNESALLSAWYEFPESASSLRLSAGQFLAGDVGGTLGFETRFDCGAKLEAYVTASSAAFAETNSTQDTLVNGLRLSVPLGQTTRYLPRTAKIRLGVEPIAHDFGQTIENPIPLHELTDQFNQSHMQHYWHTITP